MDRDSFFVQVKTGDTYKDIAEDIENAKPFCMDTDNFIVHVKTDKTYKDFAEDVVKRRVQLISNMLKQIEKKNIFLKPDCLKIQEKNREEHIYSGNSGT